jgi:TonB family protein
MSRLINQLSPNPRLQRIRVRPAGGRTPLSFEPLGRAGLSACLALLIAQSSVVASQKTPTALPARCAIVEAVLAQDGHVESARITKSAGKDFDRKALAFVKKHRYPVPKEKSEDGKLYATEAVCPHETQ